MVFNVYINIKMYIYHLYEKKVNIKNLGKVAENLLYCFIHYNACSAYRAHKILEKEYKDNGKTIDYKNVYIRIKKLHEIGLIEKSKNNPEVQQSIHNAINFKITSFGIFYVLLNNLHKYNKNIITGHEDDPLFKFFLFPYLSKCTISKLDDEKIMKKIFDYLQQCCKLLDKELDDLKEIEGQGGSLELFDFTAPFFDKRHRHDNRLQSNIIQYIRQKFSINWLNENNSTNIKIIDMIEKKKIKLTDEIDELILEIVPENQKLVVSEKQNIITEFDLSNDKENPAILLKTSTNVKEYLEKSDFFDKGVIEIPHPSPNSKFNTNEFVIRNSGLTNIYPLSLASELGYSILREIDTMKFPKEQYENSLYVGRGYKDTANLKLLANDKKFVKLVEMEKRIIDNIYKEFLEQKDN
jgi:hypothetical protein